MNHVEAFDDSGHIIARITRGIVHGLWQPVRSAAI